MMKSSEDIFHRNLKTLRKSHPTLAIELALFPWRKQNTDPLTLTVSSNTFTLCLSDFEYNFQPSPEVLRLIFFGIGGSFLGFESWLEKEEQRELIIFEDQLKVLRALLSTSIGEALLNHPRVHLFYMGQKNFWSYHQPRVESFLSQPFQMDSVVSYKRHRLPCFEAFKEKITSLSIDQNVRYAEYLYVSESMYKNILHNALKLSKATLVSDLYETFKGQPALICGAGPSLNKNAAELKALQKRALVFAGGRALSVLNDLHIEPHFALGIDPYPQHKDTLRCNNLFEIPLIFRLRMFHEALSLAQGSLFYVPGANGYPFVQWLEKELGLSPFFLDEGLNVVNFNLSVAKFLGCNPIILLGTDLAYTDQKAYSDSIPDEQSLPKLNEVVQQDFTLNRGWIGKGKDNQPIFTLWKWVEEAKWIENFAKQNPHLEILNATNGGLKIEGVKDTSVSEILEKIEKKVDYTSWVSTLFLQKRAPSISNNRLKLALEKFVKSMEKCHKHLLHLLSEKKLSLQFEVAEEDLFAEIAYLQLLSQLDQLFEKVEFEKEPFERRKKKYTFLLRHLKEYLKVFSSFLEEHSQSLSTH